MQNREGILVSTTRNNGSNRGGCWLAAAFAAQSDGFELLFLVGSQSQAKG